MIMKLTKVMSHEVIEAYKETGLIPMCGDYYSGNKGCALGVLYKKIGGPSKAIDAYSYFAKKFGSDYVDGFTAGFDGADERCTLEWSEEQVEGYYNGQAVRQVVEQEFGSIQ